MTTIAIVGDSISLGVGASPGHGYVQLLQDRYNAEGKNIQIINRSYGGALTDTAFQVAINLITIERPDYIVFFLGINDCGQAFNAGWNNSQLQVQIQTNLGKAFARCAGNCTRVILGGITCSFFPNYNWPLTLAYQYLINTYNCYPSLLLGPDVVPHTTDGIHPNDTGAQILADHLYDVFHDLGVY